MPDSGATVAVEGSVPVARVVVCLGLNAIVIAPPKLDVQLLHAGGSSVPAVATVVYAASDAKSLVSLTLAPGMSV